MKNPIGTKPGTAVPESFNDGAAFLHVLERIASALEKQNELTERLCDETCGVNYAIQQSTACF